MTHPLAAQRCADLVKDAAAERNSKTSWREADFLDGSLYIGAIAFRRYVEAVSEAIEHARRQYPGNWAYFADSLDRFVIPRPKCGGSGTVDYDPEDEVEDWMTGGNHG